MTVRKELTRFDIRDVAARKDEGGGLLVQLSELSLEREMHRAVTGNVTSSAGTRSVLVEGVAIDKRSARGAR